MHYIQNIKRLRREYGLTQGDLAGPGLSRSMISLIESGRSVPSLKTLEIVAQKLGVSASDLMEDPTKKGSKGQNIEYSVIIDKKITVCQTLIRANKYKEAQAVLTRALNELDGDVIFKGILLKLQGEILLKCKDYLRSIDMFEESLLFLDPSKQLKSLVEVYLNLSESYKRVDNYSVAIERALYGYILTTAKSINIDPSTKVKLLFNLAYCHCKKREFQRGHKIVIEALCLMNLNVVNNTFGDLLMLKGVSEIYTKDYEEAVISFKRAIDVFKLINDQKRTFECLLNLGIVYRKTNKLHQSYAALMNSYELASKLDAVTQIQNIIYELSLTLFSLNEFEQTKEWINMGLNIKPNSAKLIAMFKYLFSKVYYNEKNSIEAQRVLQEALVYFEEENDAYWKAKCLHLKADILFSESKQKNAFKIMKESSELILMVGER
ncbi:helix-turn-helix domain-containing protein [Sporolactobacillus shoreicorticis]|uniref:Helix-turn-helix domain-containing protein n=1 Tax=Sporolactobacillus shoreicorticis TaxID=1923877 RepID=A0ABW5S8I6_9BACL|nr:helix-turn-helix transcriptional regulator [Sporolactobacillus shoreicorticis]MCO7128126.1 helix-turn-helix domain-containing protein [Sporolactobacillus shoreicorticis]